MSDEPNAVVRVSPGGPRPRNADPTWPETWEPSETSTHTEWAVDASDRPGIGGVVVCQDRAEAQKLALVHSLPLLKRRVVTVRTVAADWEAVG